MDSRHVPRGSLHGFLGVPRVASRAPIQGIPLVARIWLHPKAMAKEKAHVENDSAESDCESPDGVATKKPYFLRTRKERKAARYAT